MSRFLALGVIVVAVALAAVAFSRDTGASDGQADVALADQVATAPDQAADTSDPADTAPTPADVAAVEDSAPDVPPVTATPAPDQPDIPNDGPAPSLEDLDGWLQTDIQSLDDLRGKVAVVQFWTFGCSNCVATLANMTELYARHGAGAEDFEVVGVHAPEFDYERDVDNIAEAAVDLNVTWPIALDTRKTNFHEWQPGSTAYWPRTYVLDRDGNIRFDHIGEGDYDELNATVAALLADPTL